MCQVRELKRNYMISTTLANSVVDYSYTFIRTCLDLPWLQFPPLLMLLPPDMICKDEGELGLTLLLTRYSICVQEALNKTTSCPLPLCPYGDHLMTCNCILFDKSQTVSHESMVGS